MLTRVSKRWANYGLWINFHFIELLLNECDAEDECDSVSECRTEFLEVKDAAAAAAAATALAFPLLAARATSACSLLSWLIRESLLSSRFSIFLRYSEFSLCRISTFLSSASMYSFFFLRLSWAEIWKMKNFSVKMRAEAQHDGNKYDNRTEAIPCSWFSVGSFSRTSLLLLSKVAL